MFTESDIARRCDVVMPLSNQMQWQRADLFMMLSRSRTLLLHGGSRRLISSFSSYDCVPQARSVHSVKLDRMLMQCQVHL